jgi:hypothetical protein
VITRARRTRQNFGESYENDGEVESQYQAFHLSLEISQKPEIPTFSQLRRRLFLLNDRGLNTTKTETVYTEILTPPKKLVLREGPV